MRNFSSITVAELRDLLVGQDDDTMVVFTANYGDYHNTMQALPISGDLTERVVVEEAYSRSGFGFAPEDRDVDDDDRDDEDGPTVLVIS